MIVNKKIIELSPKLTFNRKSCHHFKIQIISELSWNFLKNSKYFFFLQSSRCVSNEQPCLKQLDYMMIFYFYLVIFTFSISYSLLPFNLVYVFQFFHLFFLVFFLKSLSSIVEKLLYTYIVPGMEEPGRLQSMGSQESDTTERLHFTSYVYIYIYKTSLVAQTVKHLPTMRETRV